MVNERDIKLINLTADIVSAHVANNSVAASDVPMAIQAIYAALAGLGTEPTSEPVAQEPAVPVRSSIKQDYIICLEDGKKLKMLKRHLMAHYGMTPAEYRAKWNLPASYPMVAPAYAETRRSIAKTAGLGRKSRTAAAAPEEKATTQKAIAGAKSTAPAKPRASRKSAEAETPKPAAKRGRKPAAAKE